MRRYPSIAQTFYNSATLGQSNPSTYSSWLKIGTMPFTSERVLVCVGASGQYGNWQLGYGSATTPFVAIESMAYNNSGDFVDIPLEIPQGVDLYFQASANGANNIAIGCTIFPKTGENGTCQRLIYVAMNTISGVNVWAQANTNALPTGNGKTKGLYLACSTNNGSNTQFTYSLGYGPSSPPSNIILNSMVSVNPASFTQVATYIPFEFIPDSQLLWAECSLSGGTYNPGLWLAF